MPSVQPRLPSPNRSLSEELAFEPFGRAERRAFELNIAVGRIALAVAVIGAAWFDDTFPLPSGVGLWVMAAAVPYSLLVSWLVGRRGETLGRWLHPIDFIFPALIVASTGGVSSNYLVLMHFPVIAAAYRGGLRDTLASGALSAAVVIAMAVVPATGMTMSGIAPAAIPMERLILRPAYLLIAAALLGYLADRSINVQREIMLLQRVAARAYAQQTVRGVLDVAFEELSLFFETSTIMFGARHRGSRRAYVWGRPSAQGVSRRFEEINRDEEQALFVVPAGASSYIECSRRGGEAAGRTFVTEQAERGILSASMPFWEGWEIVVALIDPTFRRPQPAMRIVHAVLGALRGPSQNAYQVSRLRTRISKSQRGQLAQELHDGLIQSLIGLEMKVHVAVERVEERDADTAAQLAEVRAVLREQTIATRELVHQLRTREVDPWMLPSVLGSAVTKFQRESQIAATFSATEVAVLAASPVQCGALVQILQEALANVRRHSGAGNVAVHFTAEATACTLVVADDGVGFSFSGRRSLIELVQRREGPTSIVDRVRGIGAQLAVESEPRRGARLEITLRTETA